MDGGRSLGPAYLTVKLRSARELVTILRRITQESRRSVVVGRRQAMAPRSRSVSNAPTLYRRGSAPPANVSGRTHRRDDAERGLTKSMQVTAMQSLMRPRRYSGFPDEKDGWHGSGAVLILAHNGPFYALPTRVSITRNTQADGRKQCRPASSPMAQKMAYP
jgi:hypothetical protein